MSKYQQRGAYHYADFKKDSPYRKHVLDLVEQVGKVVSKELLLPKILDVGCGEGLIMHKLEEAHGYQVRGCDVDPYAVELGRMKGHDILHGKVDAYAGQVFDVVLLCDVLEHVDDFKGTIEAAKMLAPLVVIAIPDRPDGHAERVPTVDEVEEEFAEWIIVHKATRHARHLMIFKDLSGE